MLRSAADEVNAHVDNTGPTAATAVVSFVALGLLVAGLKNRQRFKFFIG